MCKQIWNNLEDENIFDDSCYSVDYKSAFCSKLLNILKFWIVMEVG